MEYLLLVTWFLGGNSTTSYQVAFASRQGSDGSPAPVLSAGCVNQR
jgi:hypothetical protein